MCSQEEEEEMMQYRHACDENKMSQKAEWMWAEIQWDCQSPTALLGILSGDAALCLVSQCLTHMLGDAYLSSSDTL